MFFLGDSKIEDFSKIKSVFFLFPCVHDSFPNLGWLCFTGQYVSINKGMLSTCVFYRALRARKIKFGDLKIRSSKFSLFFFKNPFSFPKNILDSRLRF